MASRNLISSTLARIFDATTFVASGLLAFYHVQAGQSQSLDFQRYFSLILLGTLIFSLLNNALYRSWRSEGFFKLIQTVGSVVAKTWILLIFWLLFSKANDLYSRSWLIAWGVYVFFALLVGRYVIFLCLGKLRAKGVNLKHVAIIGSSNTGKELSERIARSPWTGFEAKRFLEIPGAVDLRVLAEQPFDEIWLALSMDEQGKIPLLMEGLQNSTANVRLIPDWLAYRLINHGISEALGIEMIDLYGSPMTEANRLVKTIEDVLISLAVVILLSPVFLVLAVIVRLSSPGPVLYRQTRVGWNGKRFEMLKFRTMPVQTEDDGIVWGRSASKTVNPLCRWIRKTSLDELPQFFNVLNGDMSIVGPRPERPEFVEKFKDEVPGYMKKHMVKAGITGWAQIHGWRGDTDLNARIEHDLFYIDNWSLMLDLKIIFYTPWRGLIHKNAY